MRRQPRGIYALITLVAWTAVGCRQVFQIDDGEVFDGGTPETTEGSTADAGDAALPDGTAAVADAGQDATTEAASGDAASADSTVMDATGSGDDGGAGADADASTATDGSATMDAPGPGDDGSNDTGADAFTGTISDGSTAMDASGDGAPVGSDASGDGPADAGSVDSSVTQDGGAGDGADGNVTATVFTAVTGGYGFTCGLVSGGTVECWGTNDQGQVGLDTVDASVPVTTPALVPGVSGATAIAAGFAHVCAVVGGGTVLCWGDNTYGQLGNGADAGSNMPPAAVAGLTGATAIVAGVYSTCALVSGGAVTCWGENQYGQLGNGTSSDSPTPVPVTLPHPATALAAGGQHTCALLDDGTVECWGDNFDGDLGTGGPAVPSDAVEPDPLPVIGITDSGTLGGVSALVAGANFTCALSGGAVYCWGQNDQGDLGNGSETSSTVPVRIAGSPSVTGLVGGGEGPCALLSGGTLSCWGSDILGEVGNGTTEVASPNPSLVENPKGTAPLSGVVAAGGTYLGACAILSGGALYCWGDNSYGEIGNGTTSAFAVTRPVAVQ